MTFLHEIKWSFPCFIWRFAASTSHRHVVHNYHFIRMWNESRFGINIIIKLNPYIDFSLSSIIWYSLKCYSLILYLSKKEPLTQWTNAPISYEISSHRSSQPLRQCSCCFTMSRKLSRNLVINFFWCSLPPERIIQQRTIIQLVGFLSITIKRLNILNAPFALLVLTRHSERPQLGISPQGRVT